MENKNEKITIDFNRSSLFWLLIGVFVIAVLFSSYFFN